MGACFTLCNFTKRECVRCSHLCADKAREFIWNPAAGAVVLWYLLRNRGDHIAFVSDYDIDGNPPYRCFGQVVSHQLVNSFVDKTEETIAAGVAAGVFEDHGYRWRDETEPDVIYQRDVRISDRLGSLPDDGLFRRGDDGYDHER